MPTAYVDPRSWLSYASFVLQGLADTGHTIRWKRLVDIPIYGVVFQVAGRKVWAGTTDLAIVNPDLTAWADVTGMVNVEEDETSPVLAVGPLFGFTCWSLVRGYAAWPGLVAAGAKPKESLQQIRFQAITRRPLSAYRPGVSDASYLFARHREWSERHRSAVEPRRRFFAAIDGLPLEADVGMVPTERMNLSEYLDRTRRSVVVFNAPAVHGCLGWKLGEYLALGKAIISTPLGRRLPTPLIHGEHIHFVDDDEDAMRSAVELIASDDEYRRRLEDGARRWYLDEMTPARVVSRLVDSGVSVLDE